MNKKVISAMLAASMAVSLAACGSTATSEATSAVSSETSSTVASGESAASGSYTGTPIKVGGIGPITGAAATYGNAVKNAEELAVKEINAANGSDVFDWKFEDDEHDAEKSVNAYNSLKDWGMQVLAGPVTTTPTLAVAAESVNDNMFVMTPSASAQTVIETGDNVYQICFTDPNQGVTHAKRFVTNDKVDVIMGSVATPVAAAVAKPAAAVAPKPADKAPAAGTQAVAASKAPTDKPVSPRLGVVYHPIEPLSLYASYSRSFQPLADSFTFFANSGALAPQSTTNYEIGAKYDLSAGASVTAALFDMKQTNLTAADPVTLLGVPIGTQRTRGLELSFTGRLPRPGRWWPATPT